MELNTEGLEIAGQFGDRKSERFARANLLFGSMRCGRWDETIENADRFIAGCETSPHVMEAPARELRGPFALPEGISRGGRPELRAGSLARVARPPKDPPIASRLQPRPCVLGRYDEARSLVAEGMAIARATPSSAHFLWIIGAEAQTLGVAAEVAEILETAPDGPWKEAALAGARGDGSRAADIFRDMGAPALEAQVRFGAAAALIEEGRLDEGLVQLEKSLAFFRSVGATFFLERGEKLLAAAQRVSA